MSESSAGGDKIENVADAVIRASRRRVERQSWILGRFVRSGDPCELGKIPGPRLRIKPPWVAFLAGCQIGHNVGLHESLLADDGSRGFAILPIWRDERGDYDQTRLIE
jgi:hypothetical protein